MLKPNQTVYVTWNSKNKQLYVSKGYVFTKMGDAFPVKVEDLTKGSKAKVVVICDYCGKEIIKTYQTYLKQHDNILGDSCKEHQPIKAKATFRKKYGCDNPAQSQIVKDKMRATCQERYNTDYACQAETVKDKIKETCLEKYGATNYLASEEGVQKSKQIFQERYNTDNPFGSKEIQDKIKRTNLERYGVEHPLQSVDIVKKREQTFLERYGETTYSKTQECKDKTRQTNLAKYGYEYTLQVPEIREKGMQTLKAEGNIPTSSQQKRVFQMLKEKYDNCELNYPCGRCFLDCTIESNGVKIDVEYDGIYWHQDYQIDRRRDEFVKSQGYKVLRIKGEHEVPTESQLQEAIQVLLTTGKEFCQIDLV